MTAQFQSLVTVTVDGNPLGTFQSRTGGGTTSSTAKYRPGGMAKQKIRNGQTDNEDVTVSREWETERDADIEHDLRKIAGLAPMVVNDQPLGSDGAPFGKPKIFNGVLMSVNGGDSDAESDDGKSLELVMMVTEVS